MSGTTHPQAGAGAPLDTAQHPNPLARHYTRFRVAERLLLTGHSHQAWPDVGYEGQLEAWNDAAALVDEKWPRAAEKADRVRRGYAKLLGDRTGSIALAQNTHDLLVKFLSALPLPKRPKLVTTDGEFHSIRRQLDRLAEEKWVEVVKVSATPPGRETLRPIVTGWFSEFAHLSERVKGGVGYGEGPATWASATYDPTSSYRAARVFEFFEAERLTPELLRDTYAHQVRLLAERFDALDLDPARIARDRSLPLAGIGAFLSLESPRSVEIAKGLRSRGALIDVRGNTLRFGPAPYLSDVQLHAAMDALADAVRSL